MEQWPFRARDAEFRLVSHELGSARGSAVVVGRAGVGKSRLAHAAFDDHRDGRRAWWFSCAEAIANIPYGLFATLLSRESFGLSRSEDLRRLSYLAGALGAAGNERPSLVAVDDAHQLDRSSAALLHQLAVAGAAQLLMTVRAGEPVPRDVTRLWSDGYAVRIELGPFDRAQVHDVVGARLGTDIDELIAEQIRAWTGGNALHLRELIEAGLATGRLRQDRRGWEWRGEPVLGGRLDEIIRAHLTALPRRIHPGLVALAVAEPAETEVAVALVGRLALDELVDADLAIRQEADGQVSFRLVHPLYREPVLALATADDLAAVRAAHVAALRSRVPSGHIDLRLLQAQLTIGAAVGDDELVAAANHAMHTDQISLAGRIVDRIGDRERRRAAHGHLVVHEQRFDEAIRLLEGVDLQALPAAEVDDTVCYHANALRFVSRMNDGIAVLAAAASQSLRVSVRRGMLLHWAGADAEAVAVFDDVIAPAITQGRIDLLQECEAVSFAVPAMIEVGELSRAAELAHAALRANLPRPWIHEWWIVLLCEPQVMAAHGRLADAWRRDTTLWEESLRSVNHYAAHMSGVDRARVATTMGRYGPARTALAQAIDTVHGQLAPHWRHGLSALDAIAAAASGDLSTAATRMDALGTAPDEPFHELTVLIGYADAFVRACTGSLGEARKRLLALDDVCAARRMLASRLDGLLLLARVGAADIASARLHGLRVDVSPLWSAHAGYIDALAGDDGAALVAAGERYEALDVSHLAAEAFDIAADRLPAGRAATGARRRRDECLSRGDGVPLAWWRDRRLPWLTAREREIAALAVNLSNREIAGRLHLSVRTVENHLQQVYTKLGIAGRTEIAQRLSAI